MPQTAQDIQDTEDATRRLRKLNLGLIEQMERQAEADKRWPVLGSPWVLMASVVVSMLIGVAIGLTAR